MQDTDRLMESMVTAADFEGLARSGWSASAVASAAASLALVHKWSPSAAASMRAMLTVPCPFGGPSPSKDQLQFLDTLVNRLALSACGEAAASACRKLTSSSAQSQLLLQQYNEVLHEAQQLVGLKQCHLSRSSQQSDPGQQQQHTDFQAQQLAGLLRHLNT